MNHKIINVIFPYGSRRRGLAKKLYFKFIEKPSEKSPLTKLKLHLGCGKNYFKGWVNIDINSDTADLKADVTKGLPYEANTVDIIYNEHFIEHLDDTSGVELLKECYRVLKKGGIIRIATLDLDYLCLKYITSWEKQDWIQNRGYKHIQTKAEMMNVVFREWGHQWIYNGEELYRRFREAGFNNIKRKKINRSRNHSLRNLETRKDSKLIMESIK